MQNNKIGCSLLPSWVMFLLLIILSMCVSDISPRLKALDSSSLALIALLINSERFPIRLYLSNSPINLMGKSTLIFDFRLIWLPLLKVGWVNPYKKLGENGQLRSRIGHSVSPPVQDKENKKYIDYQVSKVNYGKEHRGLNPQGQNGVYTRW